MTTTFRRTLALACTTLALAASAALATGPALDQQVDNAVSGASFAGKMQFSVCVMDAETGRVLAEHRADRQVIPASNMKLLTSGAALSVLGPDFEFVTELVLFEGATPEGDDRLVVRGSGDPAFGDFELLEEMGVSIDEFIAHWVDAIERTGVADSVGEIVMDARIFDRELIHESWPEAQLNRWYCAQVSGINFHANVLRLYTRPSTVGRAPLVTMEPEASWIEVSNRAKTVGRGKNHTAWASRALGSNRIGLHADVRHATAPIEVTVHEPSLLLGRVIADRLASRGHSEPEVRLAEDTEDLSGGETIHRVRTPIAVVLERCNVDSHNLYAEALMKRTGAAASGSTGTWSRGAFALRSLLVDRIGPDDAGRVVIADGSGMSRNNRVSATAIAKWLRAMDSDRRLSAIFHESLPSAGEEGTLRKRFRSDRPDNEVRAKTGFLNGVSALSGYVIHEESGRTIIFSIISNDKPSSVPLSAVRGLEEDIVTLIDEHLTETAREGALGG